MQHTKDDFDGMCQNESASDHSLTEKVTVCSSRVFQRTDQALVKVLATALYKMSKTSVSMPDRFLERRRKYVLAGERALSYKSLPKGVESFSLRPPNQNR